MIAPALELKDCPVRYLITRRAGDPAHARQGRNTYATAAEAHAWIVAALKNTGPTMRSVYGGPPRLRVEAWYCWPGHFDPRMPVSERPIPRPFTVYKGVAYFRDAMDARAVVAALEPTPSAVLGPLVRVVTLNRGYAVQFHRAGSYWGPAELRHKGCAYCPGTGKGEP